MSRNTNFLDRSGLIKCFHFLMKHFFMWLFSFHGKKIYFNNKRAETYFFDGLVKINQILPLFSDTILYYWYDNLRISCKTHYLSLPHVYQLSVVWKFEWKDRYLACLEYIMLETRPYLITRTHKCLISSASMYFIALTLFFVSLIKTFLVTLDVMNVFLGELMVILCL